jgi:O-antigen/teichoic acid export membrane protein
LSRTAEPRPTLSERLPLPDGTLPVGAGLLVAGLASYAFFKVGAASLGDDGFKPVASLWFATFALAPGFFLPLEQELGRALSHRRALNQGGRPVLMRVLMLGAALAAIVCLTVLALGPVLTEHYFDGSWAMTLALVVGFLCYAPAHLARGLCSGTGRFNSYALVMGSDGVVRIILCVALAAIGIKSAGPYGFAVALAPLAGVLLVGARGQLKTENGPPASWSEVTPNLGWLLLGSVLAAGLINAGPIALGLLASEDESALVTRFGYAVLFARVTVFLFQAVQAALLPRLARLAARGDYEEFRVGFKRLMVVVVGVGIIGTIGAFLVGPPAIKLVYDADLSSRTLTMLALSSACYMVALATAQAVIALQGHARVALGWCIGMAVFVVATAFSSDELFARVEIGLLAGSAAAMVSFFFSLRERLSHDAGIDQGSLFEAITDMPLET